MKEKTTHGIVQGDALLMIGSTRIASESLWRRFVALLTTPLRLPRFRP